MTRAFRRPVSEEEVDHYQRIHKIYDAEFELEQAMPRPLMVLISPSFFIIGSLMTPKRRGSTNSPRFPISFGGACPIRTV